MSELYSTVPQREIQAAVGAVISLAKYRELMRDSASWWESGGKGEKTETATRETIPSGRFSVGVVGIEPTALGLIRFRRRQTKGGYDGSDGDGI
jgi:hypothetical protein